jgi:hypothetical protein
VKPVLNVSTTMAANRHGEVTQNFSIAFDRSQKGCERQYWLMRKQLSQEDRQRHEVMMKLDCQPT